MALFKKRDEQHIEVAAEKPSLAEAVQSARNALQQAETALASHDTEAGRLLRELEVSTSGLDAATLAGEERQIESLIRQRFDVQQRIESLDRVRPHRAGKAEAAREALYAAERNAAAEQQQTLIAQKNTLNRQIIEAVEGLGNLIERTAGVQTEIYQLADEWQLDRPALRWLLPTDFIRSKTGEALRTALDLRMTYGVNMEMSRIVSDDAALDAVIEEQVAEEEILAALAEEGAHV